MGRPKGSKNKKKFSLTPEGEAQTENLTPMQRHRLMQRQVALCVADEMDEGVIAEVLGISIDRLKALYPRELRYGREIIRADELMRLDAASAGGSVPASKAILVTSSGQRTAPKKTPADERTRNGSQNVTNLAIKLMQGGRKDG